MRHHRVHFYKGFEIRNFKRQAKLKRPAFHILREDYSVAATTSLKSARWLIDVWEESRYCACGQPRMPHDYRCRLCAKKGAVHESQLFRQYRRVG